MNRTLLTIPAWLLVTGCLFGKEDAEASGPYCEDTPTVVTLDEQTALGFSGADLLALAEGGFEETLTWTADGTTTTVTVDVAYAEGEIRHVASEAVYPDPGEPSNAIGIECHDYVEIDVTIDIATADGGLAESLETTLYSFDGTEVSARNDDMAPEELRGSYEYTALDASEYDELDVSIAVDFDELGCSGEVMVQTQGCDDECDGEDCACWAEMDTVATWPLEE